MKKKCYILMADVIKSSSYEGEELMNDFKSVVNESNVVYKKSIKSPLTITLGDEFQGIVNSLGIAIDIIFDSDESLLQSEVEYKLRYIINYGFVDTPINSINAHEMLGQGLTFAREQLEKMKDDTKETLVFGLENNKQKKLNLAFTIYRSLYNDWHPKDRKLAYDFLQNDDYKSLAIKYDKDPSSMWRKRKSLKIEDFKAARELIKLLIHE